VARKKLRQERVYLVIGLYWLLTGILNPYNWLTSAQDYHLLGQLMFTRAFIGLHMMIVIFYSCAQGTKKKAIFYVFLGFMLFELIMIIWNGWDSASNSVIAGLGALLVMVFSVAGLVEYFKQVRHSSFENTMAFVYASCLFAYGGIVMICLLNYLNLTTTSDPNEYFLYYLGLLLSSLLTCYGLWQYSEGPSYYKSENKD
jgi:drug/metabolite transporter (DMT)-like permease